MANTQFLIDICMQFGSFHMSNAVLVINSLKKKKTVCSYFAYCMVLCQGNNILREGSEMFSIPKQ